MMLVKPLPVLLLQLLALATPVAAEDYRASDSNYLQHRATELNQRIDVAAKRRALTRRNAARLHLSVRQVQTQAGNLQARNGTIERPDADRLNQQLTNVERILTRQP